VSRNPRLASELPEWLVHFRQRDDKPNRFAEYNVGSQHYPMNMKGRAWITTDNLQIVRVDAELVKPVPQLAVQHQIAEYGPVHFQKKNLDLWLPQNVDIIGIIITGDTAMITTSCSPRTR
jgi:hypothetical protein